MFTLARLFRFVVILWGKHGYPKMSGRSMYFVCKIEISLIMVLLFDLGLITTLDLIYVRMSETGCYSIHVLIPKVDVYCSVP